jgi:hypothetical protein
VLRCCRTIHVAPLLVMIRQLATWAESCYADRYAIIRDANEATAMLQNDDSPIKWAGFRLPAQAAAGHFFIVGGIASGKTLTIRALMASVLQNFHAGADRRAVVLDSNGDTIRFLRDLGISCPVYNLNPLASDGVAWDISADWTDTARADHYAALLLPDSSKTTGDFFTQAARSVLKDVLVTLILRRLPWSLSDLIDITTNRHHMRRTLDTVPNNGAERHNYPVETLLNILTTLATPMETLQAWRAGRR